ncbi:hypothetical protein AAC387_Pa10g2021 [Persea americana]
MDEAQQIRTRRESLGLNGFQILFAAVGLLQTMMKQGYEGVGVGEGKMKIISLFVSISLFAFAAAVVLPLRYTDILCRISFFFLVLGTLLVSLSRLCFASSPFTSTYARPSSSLSPTALLLLLDCNP